MNSMSNFITNRSLVARVLLFIICISLSIISGYSILGDANTFSVVSIILIILLGISIYLFFNPYRAISIFSLIVNNPRIILSLISLVLIVYFLVYYFINYYSKSSDNFLTTNYILDAILITFIIVIGLTLLYSKYRDNINLKTGHTGIILQILFFLPCLISDFIDWFTGEARLTPTSIYILLVVEIILLVIFFNLSSIMTWLSNHDAIKHIMPDPVFLKDKYFVSTAKNFNGVTSDASGNTTVNDKVKSTYCLSFWLYLNDNTGSNELQLPVFCYGGGKKMKPIDSGVNPYGKFNVHPAIVFLPKKQKDNTYGGDTNNVNIGHLGIYFSNVKKPVIIDIPLQRWNYIALNSTYTMVDLFVNGKIVYTHYMTNDDANPMPFYNTSDFITVGGKNLQGSIKDITYCDYTLSSTAIVSIYNMNMFTSKLIPTYILQ